jgi:cyclic pyranopterin phosphate synthase
MKKKELSHLDAQGRAHMVDVGTKDASDRWAVARGQVVMDPATLEAARAGDLKKGDLRAVAELAGVMAAKRTPELIPLCHPLPITSIDVKLEFDSSLPGVIITATVRTHARTGVEMEALTAVSVAALTVYDMIKGMDKAAHIEGIRLLEKHGGKSGDLVLEDWRE